MAWYTVLRRYGMVHRRCISPRTAVSSTYIMNIQDIVLLTVALAGAMLSGILRNRRATPTVSSTVFVLVIGCFFAHPLRLVVLLALYALTVNVHRLASRKTWKKIDWTALLWLTPGAVAGAGAGSVVLAMLSLDKDGSASLLRILVGATALVYIGLVFLPEAARGVFIRPLMLPVGAIYGFVSGLVGIQGLSRTTLLTHFRVYTRKAFATSAATAVIVCITRLAVYQHMESMSLRRWAFAALFSLAAWIGAATGRDIMKDLEGKVYTGIMQAALAIAAVTLVAREYI